MAREVDELFGGDVAPQPRTTAVVLLLVATLVLGAFGTICTVLPAFAPALAAWNIAETEDDRIASGYLHKQAAGTVSVLRYLCYTTLTFLSLALIGQGILVVSGFYPTLWSSLLLLILGPPQ